MNHILLTGGTGAIGSALVPRLLEDRENTVSLLLRAATHEEREAKLARLQEFWSETEYATGATAVSAVPHPASEALARGRLQVVVGDVRRHRLGMTEEDHRRLSRQVTHVIHAAGDVRLDRSLDEARASAVGGLQNILAFTCDCRRHGQFVKLDAVSTVGVAGRQRGPIPETPLPIDRPFRNTYEAAKAKAEAALLAAMAEGLPATIHRPSMVVGDARSGLTIRFQVFYYLCELLSGQRTWGIVPEMGGAQLDIVPVDYVAEAIALAIADPQSAGRVFHLCSGPRQAVALRDLADYCREIFARAGRRVPRRRTVSRASVRRLLPLATRLSPPRLRRALATLPYFLAYLEDEQTFDNTETLAFFAPRGLRLPPIEDYLDNVVDYYLRKRAVGGQKSAAEATP